MNDFMILVFEMLFIGNFGGIVFVVNEVVFKLIKFYIGNVRGCYV